MYLKYELERKNFEGIINIIKEIDNSEIIYNKGFSNIYIYNDMSELYLKFNSRQVILSRILLGKQHQGYGKQIVDSLIEFCKINEIPELVIESVSTKAMTGFCNKYDFKKVEYTGYEIEGHWYGNYMKNIL